MHIGGDTDYRLRVLEQAEIYHSPLDEIATTNLNKYFVPYCAGSGNFSGQAIEILGRNIQTRKRADGIAWFDFSGPVRRPQEPGRLHRDCPLLSDRHSVRRTDSRQRKRRIPRDDLLPSLMNFMIATSN